MMHMQGVLLLAAAALSSASHHVSTLTPPVLPLIVRNPYLSTWLGDAREEPWSAWPMFWTGEYIGFGVLASVPSTNTTYPLLGKPHDSLNPSSPAATYNVSYPEYLGSYYDASTTNLTYRLHEHGSKSSNRSQHVDITISFLSPITPQSTLRQSLPAAYISVLVEGTFDVDIYIDINGQWVSGDRGSRLAWDYAQPATSDTEGVKTWSLKRQDELLFTETNDRAEWGTLYFTGPSDAHHECGTSALLRQQFATTGALRNRMDDEFRSIMDEEPVFAFSKSFRLGTILKSSGHIARDSALFTIAHVQDPVVQYASARGLTMMRPLWKSWFPTDSKLIDFHYHDFNKASTLARNYTEQLTIDAFKSGSHNYVDIVSLAARQVLGATSFSGTPDDPLIFLKEISSNGNCQTVDVIFPAFPFFLYTNPRWGAYLLEPLLEHQLSGQYPNNYSMHDMGTHFPNQTGHADGNDEYMPVEECGDMLIMGLSLVNALSYEKDSEAQSMWSTGGSKWMRLTRDDHSVFPLSTQDTDTHDMYLDDKWGGPHKGSDQVKKWVKKTYGLWKQWTGYLVEYSLEPHNQLSTDDFAGWLALQTNLALKGIIGINAMSELAHVAGESKDADYFKNISTTYIARWEELGMSRDKSHAKLAYDWYGSWTTLYSLYSDALLCFHPSITQSSSEASKNDPITTNGRTSYNPQQLPLHVIEKQEHLKSDFIPHQIYTNQSAFYLDVMQKYGLPLDSRHLYTKSDWQFFAAAVAEPPVRKEILDRVARWVNETSTDRPFSDLFDTEGTGGWPGINFMARPVQGGLFAFLALERACGGR